MENTCPPGFHSQGKGHCTLSLGFILRRGDGIQTLVSPTKPYAQVDIVVPKELLETILDKVTARKAPEFQSVVMSLHDVLSGDFFANYIKKGNYPVKPKRIATSSTSETAYSISGDILMLSEGRIGIDNVFALSHGIRHGHQSGSCSSFAHFFFLQKKENLCCSWTGKLMSVLVLSASLMESKANAERNLVGVRFLQMGILVAVAN
jgi:hypothetical protein